MGRLLMVGRHSVVFLCAAAVLGAQTLVHADAVFDRAVEAAALAERLTASVSARDAEAYVGCLARDTGVRLWVNGTAYAGVDAILGEVRRLMAEHGQDDYEATAPRVLIEPTASWLFFDWRWGTDHGTHIAKARATDASWRVVEVDFDGGTVGLDQAGFPSGEAASKVQATLDTLSEASEAFVAGDFGRVPLATPFRFHDDEGQTFEDAEALVVAALSRVPEGITEEAMTLLVSHQTRRAIAYQDVEGVRVSLGLVRGDEWLISEASLSTRLVVLSVSPRGRLVSSWAVVRQDE